MKSKACAAHALPGNACAARTKQYSDTSERVLQRSRGNDVAAAQCAIATQVEIAIMDFCAQKSLIWHDTPLFYKRLNL